MGICEVESLPESEVKLYSESRPLGDDESIEALTVIDVNVGLKGGKVHGSLAVRVRLALKKMLAAKKLVAAAASGKKGSGSFKLPAKEPKAKKPKAKKPKAKKPKAAKK